MVITMKTLQEEVIELLMNKIGIVENEEFEVKNLSGGNPCTYKFLEGEMFELNDNGEWNRSLRWDFFIKYFDEYEFKLRTFNPMDGKGYWYVGANGEIYNNPSFSHDDMFDCLNRAMGNCFRTRESAEAHREEILKIIKGKNDE